MIDETDPYLDWDAAYTLGMLSPAERKEYERHLAQCERCTGGVTTLAGMPGILGMLSPAEALALSDATPALPAEERMRGVEHAPRPLPRATRGGALRRRSRLRMAIGGGAAVLALVIGVGAFQLGSSLAQNTLAAPAPSSAPIATGTPMQAADAAVMTAVLAIESKPWGTRLDWQCDYLQADWPGAAPTFELVITDRAGAESVLARWTGAGEHAGNLAASTNTPSSEISRVVIREVGQVDPLATAQL